jgi:amphi-Trp domain-containing protein
LSEFKHEERVSRQQAAERLADIAYALMAGGTLELRTKGEQVRVGVADEVLLKRESRTTGDRVEVEVELTWSA